MSFVYTPTKTKLLTGAINLSTSDVRLILVDSTYTASAAHEFLSAVAAGARLATAVALTGETVSDGEFDAADVTTSGVADGDTVKAGILYVHTGTDSTSSLICYIDEGLGLTLLSNGNDVITQWGAYIFRLKDAA